MRDRVPLRWGLCRAKGSDCYCKTMIKYGAISNGLCARGKPLENKVFLGFCVFYWQVCAGRARREVGGGRNAIN